MWEPSRLARPLFVRFEEPDLTSDGGALLLKKVAFPFAQILVRADGGSPRPELFELLEVLEVDYLLALGENPVLKRHSRRPIGRARRLSRLRYKTVALFGKTYYAAKSWKGSRRVV